MQIVIDIPEGLKKDFESEQWTALSCMEMKDALMNGTPLLKGHGRLIDADELIKNWYDEYIKFMTREEIESMNGIIENAPTINAIPIPKDATNGDMIKAMFPKADIEYWAEYSAYSVIFPFDNDVKYFSYDWWNAPYKAESDKESEK